MTLAELQLIKDLAFFLSGNDKSCCGSGTIESAKALLANLIDQLIKEKSEVIIGEDIISEAIKSVPEDDLLKMIKETMKDKKPR